MLGTAGLGPRKLAFGTLRTGVTEQRPHGTHETWTQDIGAQKIEGTGDQGH